MKQKTKKQLERENKELLAQLASVYHYAEKSLDKTSEEFLMGSGILVELTVLGGNKIVLPFFIKDGLSKATIDSMKKDIQRSYELATLFKPSHIKRMV